MVELHTLIKNIESMLFHVLNKLHKIEFLYKIIIESICG